MGFVFLLEHLRIDEDDGAVDGEPMKTLSAHSTFGRATRSMIEHILREHPVPDPSENEFDGPGWVGNPRATEAQLCRALNEYRKEVEEWRRLRAKFKDDHTWHPTMTSEIYSLLFAQVVDGFDIEGLDEVEETSVSVVMRRTSGCAFIDKKDHEAYAYRISRYKLDE